jgi:hypothetical protein
MTDLKAQVKLSLAAAGKVSAFAVQVTKELTDAVSDFDLAPDPFIETARLPSGVIDLKSLIDYLKSVKLKLSKRENGVATVDWDVAKSGELRLYKVFACCIHALAGYLAGQVDWTLEFKEFVNVVVSHGRVNPPENLSQSGQTMWTKTFEQPCPRTIASMTTLVYLCSASTLSYQSTGSVVTASAGGASP